MFNIEMTSNSAQINKKLAQLAMRQIPFAASRALNQTGKELLGINKRTMQRQFDNPVPYTINAFRLVRSTKQNLTAEIRRKDASSGKNKPADERYYLEKQQSGGVRPRKGIESKFKGKVAELKSMQSLLPTSRTSVRGQNISFAKSEKVLAGLQAKSNEYPRYFYGKASDGKNATDGIYRVNGPRGKPQKMFHILPTLPSYNSKYPFKQQMLKSSKIIFKRAIRAEFRNALRTAKFR